LVGKSVCCGLAVQGEEGVSGVIEILRNEFEIALTGVKTVKKLINL
jgi:isopentenyl diphosphate isomerase/L-lactate dehydrogenase-like FMN-dependent dehydrogenase